MRLDGIMAVSLQQDHLHALRSELRTLGFWYLQRGEAYEQHRTDPDLDEVLNEASLNALGHCIMQ